ncbi:MAG: FtsQ-type POTRA domain-containing protein [Clostridia bacterium]|nr:FtsQ-type POTRA domain-containing protein [Clostridia bacterium]
MKHKRLMMFTTFLVFIAVCFLCVKELFSVKDVTVVYSVTSQSVSEEVLTLLDKYKEQNIFTVDTQKIKDEITANRYLKVVSVEKKYPNEIIVKLVERTERYFFVALDGVYYFDDEYFIVRKSQDAPVENGYLTEFAFQNIDGEKIEVNCDLKKTFAFPNNFDLDTAILVENFSAISSNLLKISFVVTPEEGNYRIRLQMREGVVIEIRKAGDSLKDKLESGINYYLNAEESKKIAGTIYVQRDNGGNINSAHTFNG